jgi:hypothetical protein
MAYGEWAARFAGVSMLGVLTPAALADAAVAHVSTEGTDATACGPPADPCKTLGRAVTNAASGDEIALGPGTFPVPQPIRVAGRRDTQGDSCDRYHSVGSLPMSGSGRFDGALAFSSRARGVFVRLKARVGGSRGKGSFMTYSIAGFVALR